jgi:hypothetical protein
VTATVTGATTPATFALTNNAASTVTITAAPISTPQSTVINTAFPNALVANVKTNGTATSGATVTFSAPAQTGASCVLSATSATTDANGNASVTCTANGTAGSYNVTATTSGATTLATFALTNTLPPSTFVFYVSGEELPNANNNGTIPDYYAIAGAVQFDSTGKFLGGVQDYNDGDGITSPQPAGDTFTVSGSGFSSSVLSTGQGTLTLISSNTAEGVNGKEIFAVQFVSPTHALITQFDGTATSSGSMDLQTATEANSGSPPGTNYSFIMFGVDQANYGPVGYGGVFSLDNTGAVGGSADANDDGAVSLGNAFTGTATASSATSLGRGSISGVTIGGNALALNYYVVGPEVIRLIDVDTGATSGTGNAMVGSAYSQGASPSFNNASLPSPGIFALQGNSMGTLYATLAQFTTSNTSNATANLSGVGDDNEPGIGEIVANPFTGTYSIANGYGAMSISTTPASELGDVVNVGVYTIDPTLNLMYPNNTTTDLGGALLLDQDAVLAGGTGVIVPQTDTKVADFAGNYGAGWQEFTDFFGNCPNGCESDMVAVGSMTATTGPLTLSGEVSDPFGSLSPTAVPSETNGDTFTSTPLADTTNAGRWSMLTSNNPANQLNGVVNGVNLGFDMDIYQASGTLLFWIELDPAGVSMGPLEQQGGAFAEALHLKAKPTPNVQAKPGRSRKTNW